MTIMCLLHIHTGTGDGFAEVTTNDLHQLAMLMPGSVIAYEIEKIDHASARSAVDDSELFAELTAIAEDIE